MAATPEDFAFLPKAHMKITHQLKLEGAEEFTRAFLNSLEPLKQAGRLGPVLFQLAPTFKIDRERLARFIQLLPRGLRVAFEFRNASWFDEEVYKLLREANAALCLAENESIETPFVLTADFVYLRLRKSDYLEREMLSVEYRVDQYLSNGYPTYAIFKHEETPQGALYALEVLKQAASA